MKWRILGFWLEEPAEAEIRKYAERLRKRRAVAKRHREMLKRALSGGDSERTPATGRDAKRNE